MRENRLLSHRVGAIATLILFGLLVACTPMIRPPAAGSSQGNLPAEDHPALQSARQQLAQELNVDDAAITVVDEEAVEWPDACLGAPAVDEMCGQVVTPGYRLTLAVDGTEFVYHTNADGSTVRQVTEPTEEAGVMPADEPMTFFVESVEVRILEADPVQVEAVVRGQLADGCTTIAGATVETQDRTFVVTLQTTRPADMMCAQVLTPFEQIIALGSPEPATGAYAVQVGDVVESFTLGE